MSTNQWERLSWKMAYSMILTYNTKWVSSQLFGCGRAKLGPLGGGHLHHLMFITELLLVWYVGHMDPLLTLYSLLCVTKWQEWGEIFWRTCKQERIILKQRRRLNLVFTSPDLKSASLSSRTFLFWFET